MARKTVSFRLALSVSAAALLGLTACGGGSDTATKTGEEAASGAAAGSAGEATAQLDPVLANPQVGDLYSGELSHFSAASFGEGAAAAYGMMRVVAVNDTTVTVVTETGAYPDQAQATAELNSGSLANVTWDESERIDINRADFARLTSEGKIAAFRRP